MRPAIGLDFGTTNSAMAIALPNGEIRLAKFNGGTTFRSVLYFPDPQDAQQKPRIVAGPDAIESYLGAKSTGRLIQSMKSYLASRLFQQTQILGETYSLEELIGILLRYLRKSAEEQFGELGSAIVAGRPVHFSGTRNSGDDEFAIGRLRVAFRNAGFDDVLFVPEPVAAAYRYRQQLDHEELVLIADFGGGTSDFSLVRLQPGAETLDNSHTGVIGTDGVGIAGDAFDAKLVRNLVAPMLGLGSRYKTPFGKILTVPNWIYEHLERWHYLSFLKTRRNSELLREIRFHALEPAKIDALIELVEHDLGYRLYQAIEASKCALSTAAETRFGFTEPGMEIQELVRRTQFESWIATDIDQIRSCIDRLLADCDVAAHEIDAIFMTGGSSFVPVVRQLFTKICGAALPVRTGREFTSVAEGLALYASQLQI